MEQAKNCNETCSNYEYCKSEGNTKIFLPGATCPDYNAKDDD